MGLCQSEANYIICVITDTTTLSWSIPRIHIQQWTYYNLISVSTKWNDSGFSETIRVLHMYLLLDNIFKPVVVLVVPLECVSPNHCVLCGVCISIMSQWWCGTGRQSIRGALSMPLHPYWTCLVTPSCWEPLDHWVLGGGINWWEETAEACVASAFANQHSHRSHMLPQSMLPPQ